MSRPRPLVLAARYLLLRPIGEGATGVVWAALDEQRHELVALKVATSGSPAAAHRFVHEQSLRIRHRHVLAIHGWAAEDDLVLVASELIGGGTLAHLRRTHGPLPQAFVGGVLAQLADALEAVHRQGVVHRDLTPANVLLAPSPPGYPDLRLADFGQAIRLGREPIRPAGGEGTPGHRAPGADDPTLPAQDLWALGRLALDLLGVAEESLLSEAAGPLAPLLRRLLAVDPVRRPDARSARLELSDLVTRMAPTGPAVPDRLGLTARRHRWPLPRRRTAVGGCP